MVETSQPLVSILIPLYNAADFVGATIESILAQTYKNLEIIVSDDCSKDRSLEILRSFQDPRIKILTNPQNLGPGGNWNRVLTEAQGKYVKLVCCDDLLDPTCIARQVAILEDPSHAGVGLVGCARRIVNAKGQQILIRGFPGGRSGPMQGQEVIARTVRGGTNPIGEPASGLFRRDLVEKIGVYRSSAAYAIDVDYWVRLLAISNLYFINEPLCSFRISDKSWSASLGARQFNDYRRFMQSVAQEQHQVVGAADVLLGSAKALLNTVARVMIFKLFAK